MPRNDPTDTGGLFIGRRPGTGPLHYRGTPERGGPGRRRTDAALALALLGLEGLVCLSLWGAEPVGGRWGGAQVDYRSGSVTFGIAVAFAGMIATLMMTLAVATRLDRAWRILRRAAGHEQREGMLVRIFATTAVIAGVAFLFWFVILEGPAPSL